MSKLIECRLQEAAQPTLVDHVVVQRVNDRDGSCGDLLWRQQLALLSDTVKQEVCVVLGKSVVCVLRAHKSEGGLKRLSDRARCHPSLCTSKSQPAHPSDFALARAANEREHPSVQPSGGLHAALKVLCEVVLFECCHLRELS